MAVTATPVYGTVTSLTWAIGTLASDANLFIGRASTAVDNTSDLADDSIVGGQFLGNSVAPTTGKQIEVWAYASFDGTNYNAQITGTDASFTATAVTKVLMRLITIIPTDATTSATYTWGPFSIAQAFGGTMPRKWGLFCVHNMGQAFLTGSLGKYTPVKYQSA